MPCKVGVKIKAGRNLPIMDRSSDTTDAYVEIKLGNVTHKTDVCRKSLNPQWNSNWFRFEVDDAELQDEPLQIRLMDHDTYSANDAIGKVNISLNPLCLESLGQTTHGKGPVFSGWIPVFDTMHGIRGEVNVIVKVDLFSDLNKFRQSSCGIPFFHSQCIPFGYRAQIIHGFVEELVVNDDPEYQWIDKIRTPRASNEARQVVFLKLSGQVQRKMGLKAINMGANAVIGYTQCFDLEGDVGVVARGIGTAVTLIKDANSQSTTVDNALIEERTQKYLDFLTGTNCGIGIGERSDPYELQIKKSNSSTLFELKRKDSEVDSSSIMHDLLRQEDERGERPVTKLKYQMRKFTNSSRNLLNEKYTAFMRKLGDNSGSKSPDSTSCSLNNLMMAPESSSKLNSPSDSARSSLLDVRYSNFVANEHLTPLPVQRESFKKMGVPLIVRSVSNDSAMKESSGDAQKLLCFNQQINAINEYQDSTHSSPNISSQGRRELLHASIRTYNKESDMRASAYSSALFSLGDSVSSSEGSALDLQQHIPFDDDAGQEKEVVQSANTITLPVASPCTDLVRRKKLEELFKICSIDEEERVAEQWIQPGQSDSLEDNNVPNVTRRRHSLMQDLKIFSHHIQDMIHFPRKSPALTKQAKEKKSKIIEWCQASVKPHFELTTRREFGSVEQKPFYSSHPDICLQFNETDPSSTNEASIPLRARSLNNLLLANSDASIKEHLTLSDNKSLAVKFEYPILKISPSTPTPSESDNSQLSPTDIKSSQCSFFQHYQHPIRAISPISHLGPANISRQPLNTNLTTDKQQVNIQSVTPINSSCQYSPLTRSMNSCMPIDNVNIIATNNEASSNQESSLLASFMPTPSSLHIKHDNHRSLSDVNGTASNGGTSTLPTTASPANAELHARTDSPNSKCVAPVVGEMPAPAIPQLSSVVAEATIIPTQTPTTTTATTSGTGAGAGTPPTTAASTVTTAGSGVAEGVRHRLSPSPSKNGSETAVACSQTDSLSSTNTSTATTMIPKEMGEICRRSSDSDLSVTPKGNSICVASERLVAATAMMRLSQPITGKTAPTDNMDNMLEYPFLTMTKYPAGFILHLGATVAARSVKLLERVPNPDEPEVRDSWWTELRMEIRSHARALGCNVVLGYSEATTISDDVCVLSATGTAAVINMAYNRTTSQSDIFTMTKPSSVTVMSASLEERDMLRDLRNGLSATEPVSQKENAVSSSFGAPLNVIGGSAGKKHTLPALNITKNSCNICHIPYNLSTVPFNVKMKKCAICRKGRVPDVLLATLEVPEFLQVTGRGCFMQAQVMRAKKDLRSESNAKEISDGLPFLEYELHRVLINKLKAKGMNAIFGLKAQVAIGERMISLIATGTALFLSALPVPQVPKIVAGNSWTDKQRLNELQKKLQETYERNQEIYQLKCMDPDLQSSSAAAGADKQSDTDESDDEVIEIDLNCGNKDTCVLEVDDIEDLEIISLLMEPHPPEGFHVVNTQMVPGLADMEAVKNLQMFTQVWRAKLDIGQNTRNFPKHFQRLLQTIYFKLRTMAPCAICDLRFRLDLPESDQIQLLVTGMALGLGESNKPKYRRKLATTTNGLGEANTNGITTLPESNCVHNAARRATMQDEDYIFPLDEDQMIDTPTPTTNIPHTTLGHTQSLKLRKSSPSRASQKTPTTLIRSRYFPLRDRYGIDITPLSFIPGGRIEYLGNLNFFFIRESTSIRENGGISGFVHSFITELLAVVRAHIAALGGNAMVSFYMTELILVDNQHKNQGQCLISIGGDAVYVSYYSDD